MPEGQPETILYVCTTCRGAGDPSDERPGARLLAALRADEPVEGLRIEGVECLSVCKRPCTIAVASPGRWTYVYGDLDPAASAAVILDGVRRYAETPDGIVPWRERPDIFRKGVIARIPPRLAAEPSDPS